jgi:TFIIF-interacting CTD phosphatase-like protein
MDKLNIILDLDECLLYSILQDLKESNYKEYSSYQTKLKKIGFPSFFFKYKFDGAKSDEYSLTVTRPHLQEFITYLFKHYNVSVWSNGYYTYVDKICDIIFTKSQRNKLKIIFGSTELTVYDIKNKKEVYNYAKYNKRVKDLSHLFKTKPYSTIFNKDNTILIDDSQYHLDYNKHNVLNIKHWLFYEQDDIILLKVIDYLKSSNINTAKLPRITHSKKQTKKKTVKKQIKTN